MSNTGFKVASEASGPGPIILAIDTSSPDANLTISSGENIVAALTVRNNRPHSQTLFSYISTILQLAEMNIQDISAFAVATGPGSFTGLRVGLAAVKGLADSLGKPCLGADSLDLHALASGSDGEHIVVIAAGRGEVYCGLREVAAGNIINRSTNDMVGKPAVVFQVLMQNLKQSALIITGDEGLKYKDEIFELINRQMVIATASGSRRTIFFKPAFNTSSALARMAGDLVKKGQLSPVSPHYVRQSDAEIRWRQ